VAWTPLPLLAAWLVGVARAIRRGRDGEWAPIVLWLGWLAVGTLDGGLFGGRNSLLALLWVPAAITAAHGARSILEQVESQLIRRRGGLVRWLSARSPRARALGVAVVLLLVPVLRA
jgi:hypothetical protein